MTITEKAIQQMESWANNSAHGYDQRYRWGEYGDYDCSAAVISAWRAAGLKLTGASYTGNMIAPMLAEGFTDVTSRVNLKTQEGLLRGDVLYIHNSSRQHVGMYCGNGYEVEALINEFGDIVGGQPGDQTGGEFVIRPYQSFWVKVYRYKDATNGGSNFMYSVAQIKQNDSGNDVYLMQSVLRGRGYKDKEGKNLVLDGSFGPRSDYAVRQFQSKNGLVVDGICGPNTWKKLLKR